MHKIESVLRSLIMKGLLISFGLISLAALYYRDGKFQIAENGNVIIEELFSGLILLYLFFTFFLVNEKNNKKKYIPPTFDGEKIVPGYFNE